MYLQQWQNTPFGSSGVNIGPNVSPHRSFKLPMPLPDASVVGEKQSPVPIKNVLNCYVFLLITT